MKNKLTPVDVLGNYEVSSIRKLTPFEHLGTEYASYEYISEIDLTDKDMCEEYTRHYDVGSRTNYHFNSLIITIQRD